MLVENSDNPPPQFYQQQWSLLPMWVNEGPFHIRHGVVGGDLGGVWVDRSSEVDWVVMPILRVAFPSQLGRS